MSKQVKLKDGICTKVNKEDGSVIKFVTNTKITDLGDRTLRFVFSNEEIDRDEELILASGWKLDNYIKAPVILPYHNRWGPSVAKTVGIEINSDKELVGDVKFPTKETSEQGDFLYRMYKEGFMFATSVGFIPEYDKMIFGDTSKGEPWVTYAGQELLEVSLVSVPANPNALIKSKSFQKGVEEGKITKDDLSLFDSILKVAAGETEDEKSIEEIMIESKETKRPEVKVIDVKAVDVDSFDKYIKENKDILLKIINEHKKQSNFEADIDEVIEKINNVFTKYGFGIKSLEQTIDKCPKCGHELTCSKCDSEDFNSDFLKKYFSEFGNVVNEEQLDETDDETEGRYDELLKIIKIGD